MVVSIFVVVIKGNYNMEYLNDLQEQIQKSNQIEKLIEQYLFHEESQYQILKVLKPYILDTADIVNKLEIELQESLGGDCSRGYCDDVKKDYDKIYIGDTTINLTWSKNWSYGGHDEGCVTFPKNLVFDKDKLEEFVSEKRKRIQTIIKCRENREREELRESIERQQQKLEELNKNANS
jgi:hypothetical protein